VPNIINSSPGPSELGTMTATAADGPREAIFMTMAELAVAENPLPPYCSGMTSPRNPWRFRNSQISSGISRCSKVIFQSSMSRHSSSVGPSRKACSFWLSSRAGLASSLAKSGSPRSRSASQPIVPAASASRSVSDMAGRMPRTQSSTGRLTWRCRNVSLSDMGASG
jgi:hypothetical protein